MTLLAEPVLPLPCCRKTSSMVGHNVFIFVEVRSSVVLYVKFLVPFLVSYFVPLNGNVNHVGSRKIIIKTHQHFLSAKLIESTD